MKLRKAGKTKQERKGSINEAAVEGWLGDENTCLRSYSVS
jgi:hypothetical protein